MATKIHTVAFEGIKAHKVTVETQISPGLPAFHIVGLADKAVAESRERIRAALHAISLSLPPKRITVNLAPADLQKEGSHYDLPIALAILGAMDVLDSVKLDDFLCLGEISLDGGISKVNGALPAAICANNHNLKFMIPKACQNEARWSGHEEIIMINHLLDAINHFQDKTSIIPLKIHTTQNETSHNGTNLKDIRGQHQAKRALEIAAMGGHNLLMIGPPGVGKSLLASAMPSILPDLEMHEALETSMIHSISGLLPESGIVRKRPFRSPHHTASTPSIVGGGSKSAPGEISLAHNGVLFLDEFPEFSRNTLEALRQPLETKEIHISRVRSHATYPANLQLIAAMNPCRCGYLGDVKKECHRVPVCGEDYRNKISGPLLDRFDMVVYLKPIETSALLNHDDITIESSETVAKRVKDAQSIQIERFSKINSQNRIRLNADARGEALDKMINLTEDGKKLCEKAIDRHQLSARGYHRLLRVSRTIADAEGADVVDSLHISEALSYR